MRAHALVCSMCLALAACGEPAPAVDPDRSYLTSEERLRLFDLERSDHLLGIALAPFQEGIRTGDQTAIRDALSDSFRAVLPAPPDEAALEVGDRFYRRGVLDRLESTDREGFVRWASAIAAPFETIDTVAFNRYRNSSEIIDGPAARAESAGSFRIAGTHRGGGLLELSGKFELIHDGFERFGEDEAIEHQEVDVSRWIHELGLADVVFAASEAPFFKDVTETCGIDVSSLHDNWVHTQRGTIIFTGGAFLGDVDHDTHLDLLVTEMLRTRLYLGNGDGTFTANDWKPRAPMVKLPNGQARVLEPYATIFDADGNGKVDVLHAGTLYTWSDKRNEMVRLRTDAKLPNADASLCDYDRDGLVDLYFVNSGKFPKKEDRRENVFFDDERTNGRANQLFRNMGGGRFKNVTKAAHASPGFGRTFATTWFYANDDDWPDLFGANEFGRNVFLINQGDGSFREVDDVDPVFGGFSMGVTSGDMDGDGRADLYVSNMYSKAGQRVYHHLDLDIYPENARRMFVASVTGNRLYSSRGDLTFEDARAYAGGYAVGWGFSGAMFDFDLDGWLDVYAPCGYISVDRTKPDG